jgi:hypothetical protein
MRVCMCAVKAAICIAMVGRTSTLVERCGLFSDLPCMSMGATEDGILSVDTADILLNALAGS